MSILIDRFKNERRSEDENNKHLFRSIFIQAEMYHVYCAVTGIIHLGIALCFWQDS